jgi:hypothetical protein
MAYTTRSAWLIVLVAAFFTSAPVVSQVRRLAITNVNVVDVTSGAVLPTRTVVITGDTITDISDGAAPAGIEIVQGQGKFLIPGLWDMHAHIQGRERGWLALYVANGVTGIRDMGGDLEPILASRAATASGRVLGPQIIAAGPILDDAPGDWPLRMRVRNAEQGRAAVQLLKRRGVDLIKVHNFTPRDAFLAIADEARRQNLPVAGHVPLKMTAEEAIEGGLMNVEHLSKMWMPCSGGREYRPGACAPFFTMLAQREIWQTPTLVAGHETAVIGTPASTLNPDHVAYANKYLRGMWAGNQSLLPSSDVIQILKAQAQIALTVTRDMARAGVGILAGCDALIAGFCVHDELAKMVEAGMTPLAALQTATLNPARHLGMEETLGTIAVGKRADFVLLDANPLEDIANVRRLHAVMLRGRLLDRGSLDNLLSEAQAAATE